MRRPTRVVVGPFTWKVDWTQPADDVMGETLLASLTIRVDPTMHEDVARETLMHEVLHACYKTAGIDSTVALEEQIVSGVSPLLLDALRRSPNLAEYLLATPVGRRGGDRE